MKMIERHDDELLINNMISYLCTLSFLFFLLFFSFPSFLVVPPCVDACGAAWDCRPPPTCLHASRPRGDDKVREKRHEGNIYIYIYYCVRIVSWTHCTNSQPHLSFSLFAFFLCLLPLCSQPVCSLSCGVCERRALRQCDV